MKSKAPHTGKPIETLPLRAPPPRYQGFGFAAEPALVLRGVDPRLRVRLTALHVVDARAVSADVSLDAAVTGTSGGRSP